MVGADGLRDVLAAELPAMVQTTKRLAAIDSGSRNVAGVNAVQDGFAALFAAKGFVIERAPLDGLGDRVTARIDRGPGPRLIVLGHADTVWEEGWPVTVDGDWLRGPGVGDMKACVVMAAHALALAAEHLRAGSIEVLLVPDEELGSRASRSWIEARAGGAAACLGLEAGWPGGGVVRSRGAVGAMVVRATGRAAHCAAHEDGGASALAALAPLVEPLERVAPEGGRVGVGVFRAGTARQVVPAEAFLELDLRAPTVPAADAMLTSINALVDGVARPGVSVAVEGGFTRPPFASERSEVPWRSAVARAAELGIPLRAEHSRGGGDASFAAALGVPTLDGLGPICRDSCARDERIEIGSLADRGALLAGLALDLLA